jgi:hypothetical protein
VPVPIVSFPVFERYGGRRGLLSHRDPFDDLVLQLEFLSATKYVVDIMQEKHGVGKQDAIARAPKVAAHVRLAIAYLEQATTGPAIVSFVPCYYALLNLVKIYILFGDKHSLLAVNRHHGASYNPSGPLSRNLDAESIAIFSKGAIPLFYESIVGKPLGNAVKLRLGEVYPYILDVSAEWSTASGQPSKHVSLAFDSVQSKGGGRVPGFIVTRAASDAPLAAVTVNKLPVLVNYRRPRGATNRFVSHSSVSPDASREELLLAARASLRNSMLYYPINDVTTSVVTHPSLLMFEELPIVLAFFHLSSVARYRPEFLERLRDSQYWPTVAAARGHAMFKFLLLFWSFVTQSSFHIHSAE